MPRRRRASRWRVSRRRCCRRPAPGAIFQLAVAVGKFQGEMTATHAHRLATHVDLDARTDRIGIFSELAQHLGSEIGKELAGTVDLASALGQRLALFPAEQRAQLFSARHQFPADRFENGLARLEPDIAPCRQRSPGRGNGNVELTAIGLCVQSDKVGDVRRIAVLDGVNALQPLPGNEISVQLGHCSSLSALKSARISFQSNGNFCYEFQNN